VRGVEAPLLAEEGHIICYLRDGDRVFLTYETRGRGIEAVGTVWSFLDRTPLGRQEEWEDTPAGRPQGPPYEWWRRHDEYESNVASDPV
jgi:predicted dithiol-disulfide oxidoreductase (DUF899 family)